MDKYREVWENFISNILSKNYDKACEFWDPKTRKVFRKNIKSFRKKHRRWRSIEYAGISDDGYIVIRYYQPKGLVARLAFSFNQFRIGKDNKLGRLIYIVYKLLEKIRKDGYGYLNVICGIIIKKIAVTTREFCSKEIIKKYTPLHYEGKDFLGWSYIKAIIPEKINYKYKFDTFKFFSAVNYSHHLPMLVKLDSYIKNILKDIDVDIPPINIYFHAKLNTYNTGIPKSFFATPGRNSICIYHIRVKYDELCHEVLHAIIYAATSSWPSLFFREGYAESYEHDKDSLSILQQKVPISFLCRDSLFFDFSESPPIIAGVLVRYLISQYGIRKFYMVYKKAEFDSVKKVLKKEYGLSIRKLKKHAIIKYKQKTNSEK